MADRDTDDALTRLVQQRVGEGRPLTVRAFAERAIDPKTGQGISKSTAGNIVNGHQIKLTPALVRAIAAGLGAPLAEVRDAAIRQYVGAVMGDPFEGEMGEGVIVTYQPGMTTDEIGGRNILEEWSAEERERNQSAPD